MRLIPSDPDIATIVGRIFDGSLDLRPAFQRGEVWSQNKQRLLIDSVLRNWYIPPIHVIRTSEETQEVLDGQQRLFAISEFVRGKLRVDGNAAPVSTDIQELDGSTYETLPTHVRRRFDRFPIRQFELIEYLPEEPYELFYRLNQPTTLTSAEKRNAFFGPARDQVKMLTEQAQMFGMTADRVGYSDARLAYEDVIARFVWTLEIGTLREKLSANKITARYRSTAGFDDDTLSIAGWVLKTFFSSNSLGTSSVRLNKATTHSWLCFVAAAALRQLPISETISGFLYETESTRAGFRASHSGTVFDGYQALLLPIFTDRSTARVFDVSSVLLRDSILWLLYSDQLHTTRPEVEILKHALGASVTRNQAESNLLKAIDDLSWGRLR